MKLQEIRNKHPPGTSQKHLTKMKKYMDEGLSFQQAHNKAEATGAPAFPNQNGKLGYILNQDLMNKPGFAGLGEAIHPSILFGYPLQFAATAYFAYRVYKKQPIGNLAFMMLGGGLAYSLGRQIDMAEEGKQVRAFRKIFS